MEILTIALIQTEKMIPEMEVKGSMRLNLIWSAGSVSTYTCFAPAQEKSFLSSNRAPNTLSLVTIIGDLNQPNNVWIIHLLILFMLSCMLWLSSKRNSLPRLVTFDFSFTRAASAVSLLSANVGHRWMPSHKSNQQDNVLVSQEWTLMTKSPVRQSPH